MFSLALAGSAMLGAGCGRTELDEWGGGTEPTTGTGGRDAGTDGRLGSGGNGAGGRVATGTGGRAGTGGRQATGGRAGSGGRPGTGGRGSGGSGAGGSLIPPTPGILVCGTQICASQSQACCVGTSGGMLDTRCVPTGAMCGGAASLSCDEPADCNNGVCCAGLDLTGGTPLVSRCVSRAACTGFAKFVVCRQNSDCAGTMTPVCCANLGIPLCQASCGR